MRAHKMNESEAEQSSQKIRKNRPRVFWTFVLFFGHEKEDEENY